MTVSEYINTVPTERQDMLLEFHEAILANDSGVASVVKPMMGKEMILYEQHGYMKYALASAKNHMSLHCLPMYIDPSLHTRYTALLPAAKFQKGCINFTDEAELPASSLAALIEECSSVNIAEVLEKRKKK